MGIGMVRIWPTPFPGQRLLKATKRGFFVFILHYSIFVLLVNVCFCCFFSTKPRELAGKNVSKVTCFVLSGMLNLNLVFTVTVLNAIVICSMK